MATPSKCNKPDREIMFSPFHYTFYPASNDDDKFMYESNGYLFICIPHGRSSISNEKNLFNEEPMLSLYNDNTTDNTPKVVPRNYLTPEDTDKLCFLVHGTNKIYGSGYQNVIGTYIFPDDFQQGHYGVCVTSAHTSLSLDRKEVKIWFKPDDNVLVDSNDIEYSLDKVYVLIDNERGDNFQSYLGIYQLSDLDFFKDGVVLSSIKREIKNHPLPDERVFNSSFSEFQSNPCDYRKIRCRGVHHIPLLEHRIDEGSTFKGDERVKFSESVKVPLYLRQFFSQELISGRTKCLSPIFVSGFEESDKGQSHDIDISVLKLMIKWLLNLMIKRQYPSAEEIVNNDVDLNQWIYVCDYIGLDLFKNLFEKIRDVINHFNSIIGR